MKRKFRTSAIGRFVKKAEPTAVAIESAFTVLAFAPARAFHAPQNRVVERVRSAKAFNRWYYESAPRKAVWMLWDPSVLKSLATDGPRPSRDQRVLCMQQTLPQSQHVLDAYFSHALSLGGDMASLEPESLADVITSDHRRNLLIAATYDRVTDMVVLYRGDLETLLVPLSWFRSAGSGVSADPSRLEITDYGHTVKLGDFEAAVDAILYEFDADYRREAKTVALVNDSTIGGSIRRLRLQRGLKQNDLVGVDAKTLARIERGEVAKPQPATLSAIASALNVSVRELRDY